MTNDNEPTEERQYPTPPPGIKVLSNGAGYDIEQKRIADGPGTYAPDPHRLDHAKATQLIEHRWQIARQAAAVGLANAGRDRLGYSKVTELDAWSEIVRFRADNAMTNAGRVGVQDAKFVGQAAGLLRDQRQNAPELPASGVTVHVGADSIARLKELLDNRSTDS